MSSYQGYLGMEPHVRPSLLLSTFRRSLDFVRQQLLELDEENYYEGCVA